MVYLNTVTLTSLYKHDQLLNYLQAKSKNSDCSFQGEIHKSTEGRFWTSFNNVNLTSHNLNYLFMENKNGKVGR